MTCLHIRSCACFKSCPYISTNAGLPATELWWNGKCNCEGHNSYVGENCRYSTCDLFKWGRTNPSVLLWSYCICEQFSFSPPCSTNFNSVSTHNLKLSHLHLGGGSTVHYARIWVAVILEPVEGYAQVYQRSDLLSDRKLFFRDRADIDVVVGCTVL